VLTTTKLYRENTNYDDHCLEMVPAKLTMASTSCETTPFQTLL